jgi:hypothetical protein
MIDSDLFSVWGNAVLLAWAALAVAAVTPRSSFWGGRLATAGGFYAPVILSVGWVALLVAVMTEPSTGDLFTLSGVATSFANHDRLFLLYFECLTLSLYVGGWIVLDARLRGVSRLVMIVVLPLQFLFGPAGLAAYVAARKLRTISTI